jgi:5-methylcytosine-specific restriction endonuclease McrA
MPITEKNKGKYPPRSEWKKIRAEILARAGNKCERCKLPNGKQGWRDKAGTFHEVGWDFYGCSEKPPGWRAIKIVLTIAHLDHDPTNNDPANLQALCQKCHNNYDQAHRQVNASITRRRKKDLPGQLYLFGEPM